MLGLSCALSYHFLIWLHIKQQTHDDRVSSPKLEENILLPLCDSKTWGMDPPRGEVHVRSHKMGKREKTHFCKHSVLSWCLGLRWCDPSWDYIYQMFSDYRQCFLSLDTDRNCLKCEYSPSTWYVSSYCMIAVYSSDLVLHWYWITIKPCDMQLLSISCNSAGSSPAMDLCCMSFHSQPGVGFSHVFLHYSPEVVLWTSGVSWWSSSMIWNIIPRWYDDVHQFWRAVEISQTPFWMHPSIITPCVHHAPTHLLLTVFLTFFRKTNTTCQCRVKTGGCHPGDEC